MDTDTSDAREKKKPWNRESGRESKTSKCLALVNFH